MNLRDAQAGDAAALVAIYNHFILNTAISFEETAIDAAAMAQRIADVQDGGLPWIVLADGEQIFGYAYATKWRVRHAYRFSVETSVYLHPERGGGGLGTRLYTELLRRLRDAGVHLAIGGIALPNAASVALHERMGFRKVAHFEEVGFKFGAWRDVGYWQLRLGDETAPV